MIDESDRGGHAVSMTSARMRRVGRRDTKPEKALRSVLFSRGFRYRVDEQPIPGLRTRADLVFRRARVAVFVDGCFWHGCPEHATWPKNNSEFWRAKIVANQERDLSATEALERSGWTVIRLWEHEDPVEGARVVEAALSRASAA